MAGSEEAGGEVLDPEPEELEVCRELVVVLEEEEGEVDIAVWTIMWGRGMVGGVCSISSFSFRVVTGRGEIVR